MKVSRFFVQQCILYILFNNHKVLAKIPHYFNRKIQEITVIYRHPNNFNKDSGVLLFFLWKVVIPTRLEHHTCLPQVVLGPATLYKYFAPSFRRQKWLTSNIVFFSSELLILSLNSWRCLLRNFFSKIEKVSVNPH